jgi:hypothetical protein
MMYLGRVLCSLREVELQRRDSTFFLIGSWSLAAAGQGCPAVAVWLEGSGGGQRAGHTILL